MPYLPLMTFNPARRGLIGWWSAMPRVPPPASLLCCRLGSLVALWRFNEGSGTTAFDSSGFGNNGTLVGENGNVPAWVSGKPGLAEPCALPTMALTTLT